MSHVRSFDDCPVKSDPNEVVYGSVNEKPGSRNSQRSLIYPAKGPKGPF